MKTKIVESDNMKFRIFVIYILVVWTVSADLQGPPSDTSSRKQTPESTQTSNNDRKVVDSSTKDEISTENDDSDNSLSDDEITTLLVEELALQGSAIKIIKSPDLSKEKEAQKVSDMLSTIVNSHAKLIKKLENEIEEMDGSIASLTASAEPDLLKSPDEIELDNLYDKAMEILNKTKADKESAYGILRQAADRGHAKSQAKIAWAQLMGNPFEMNFEEAKKTFLKLADYGLPDAHMVCILFSQSLDIFIFCCFTGAWFHACCRHWFQC